MSEHSIIPSISGEDNTNDPLPIRVSRKWQFPLAYMETENGLVYSIQDWIVGLTGASNPRRIWSDLKSSQKEQNEEKESQEKQLYDSTVQLPYTATDGKTYQMEFISDKGLYLIAQYLLSTKSRPALEKIRKYLAEAGAFVDLVRREPETVVTSGALNTDQAVDATIKGYRKQGKDDHWITVRILGKIKREQFTTALKEATIEDLKP